MEGSVGCMRNEEDNGRDTTDHEWSDEVQNASEELQKCDTRGYPDSVREFTIRPKII